MASMSGRGGQFRLVDTGGIVPDDAELIPTEIYNQARVALQEAAALVLVVDVRTELASPDYDLVKLLLKGGKPVFLAVNKVEGQAMELAAENLRQLGIKEVYPISAEHALGIGELLDAISAAVPAPEPEPDDELAGGERGFRGRTAGAGQARRGRDGRSGGAPHARGSMSSARPRLRLSGGRMWASRRC